MKDKLNNTDRYVLRLVAQDEDYEVLQHLLAEMEGLSPDIGKQEVLDILRQSVRSLISAGLIELYRRGPTGSPYELLAGPAWEKALAQDLNWRPRDSAPNEEFALAATERGWEAYRGSFPIQRAE